MVPATKSVRQVTAERCAHRGPQLPIERGKQIFVKKIPLMRMWYTHELGHVCALPGEDHFRGGMIDAANRGARLVAGSHRFPRSGVDVFAKAEGRPQWCPTLG